MSKKQILTWSISIVILSVLMNVFFGRFLAVKISTIPLLNRWKLISPLAPIVINTREEVRVNDSQDILQTVNLVRPKISLAVSSAGGQVTVLGGVINLTSDGLFITAKNVVDGQKNTNLSIKLDDGTVGQVTTSFLDAATGLVVLKTSLNGVPVADLGDSKSLQPGQRIIYLIPTIANFAPSFAGGFVSQSQSSDQSLKDADVPSSTFKIQVTEGLMAGTSLADANGSIMGLWDGTEVVPSNVIKNLANLYLGNQGKIIRPVFGFHYRSVGVAEAKILNESAGLAVTSVAATGPAQKSGMQVGDIIQSWDGTTVSDSVTLEELLQKYKPGDQVSIKVMRGKNLVNINLTVGPVK